MKSGREKSMQPADEGVPVRRPWALVEVGQPGVLAERADDLQVRRAADAVNEAGLGEVCVHGQVAAQLLAVPAWPDHHLCIMVDQVNVLSMAFMQAGCLDSIQMLGGTVLDRPAQRTTGNWLSIPRAPAGRCPTSTGLGRTST